MTTTMTFVLPSAATTENPIVISNSPITEVLSPNPVRRVSFDEIVRLADLIETSGVPSPSATSSRSVVTASNTVKSMSILTTVTSERLNSSNSRYHRPAAVNKDTTITTTTTTTTDVNFATNRRETAITTASSVFWDSGNSRYIPVPPPAVKRTAAAIDPFFTYSSTPYSSFSGPFSSYNKNKTNDNHTTNKHLSEVLLGSVPDYGTGGRYGVIGEERRGKSVGVIGGERVERGRNMGARC
ncbi:hypothetical protein IFR04_007559 [Cadophora malorum]|uniref:Uncharacterized protein n=1 Tax=Cadophora malorum TaxID=108018 RepID=A0A8H7TCZ6_9HELO|nr:hypothetical protein IFR04_007559 [Cadophora malorum]